MTTNNLLQIFNTPSANTDNKGNPPAGGTTYLYCRAVVWNWDADHKHYTLIKMGIENQVSIPTGKVRDLFKNIRLL